METKKNYIDLDVDYIGGITPTEAELKAISDYFKAKKEKLKTTKCKKEYETY